MGLASVVVSPDEEVPTTSCGSGCAEKLTYESVTNYARAAKGGGAQNCVMCGGKGKSVVIPRQNKDVCRECDKAIWRHEATGAHFKWCKGCKNFLEIASFSQKLDAAKCDKCRERGRTSYLLKKRYSSPPSTKTEPDSAAAISLVALSHEDASVSSSGNKMSANFGCSLLDLLREDEEEDPPEEAPAGLLFELASIHSTILKLEQRAELVEPLEAKLSEAEKQRDRALQRLASAQQEIETLKHRLEAVDDDDDDDENPSSSSSSSSSKRPRFISFDSTSPPARRSGRSTPSSSSSDKDSDL